MKVKRFFGKDMRQALTEITNELGPDAAILANNKLKDGVEIIAAIDYDDAIIKQRHQPMETVAEPVAQEQTAKTKRLENILEKNPAPLPLDKASLKADLDKAALRIGEAMGMKSKNPKQLTPTKKTALFKHLSAPSAVYRESGKSRLRSEVRSIPNSVTRKDGPVVKDNVIASSHSAAATVLKPEEEKEATLLSKPNLSLVDYQVENLDRVLDFSKKSEPKKRTIEYGNNIEWLPDANITAMREELEQLKKAVGERKQEEAGHLQRHLFDKLLARGFEKGISDKVSERAASVCTSSQAWRACQKLLEKNIMVQNDCFRSGIVALWGPSGVGKSTALAKLAAHHTLINGPEDLAILSTDHYRIGAYEQLRKYGQLIGCETGLIESPESLERLVKKFSHKSLILIDTGGISQTTEEYYTQQKLLSAIRYRIKNLFVLAASYQYQAMNRLYKVFSDLKPEGLVVTKTDESSSFGEIISFMINKRLMVCGSTDSGKVTENLRHLEAKDWIEKAFDKDSGFDFE